MRTWARSPKKVWRATSSRPLAVSYANRQTGIGRLSVTENSGSCLNGDPMESIGKQQMCQNQYPISEGDSVDDITTSQGQPYPDRLPKSLIEWQARINRRYLALNKEKANDTSKSSTWLLLIGGIL